MRALAEVPHPVRPGYTARWYGVVCAGCWGPLYERTPDPSMRTIRRSDGSLVGYVETSPDAATCQACCSPGWIR